MKLQKFMPIVLIAALIATPTTQVLAQGNQRGQCQPFVRQAYTSLSTNCLKLDSNIVCYGHEDVSGMLIEGQSEPADFFDEAGYESPLTYIALVTGSAFNLADEIWGLAKLNITTFTDDIENDDLETIEDNLRDVTLLLFGDMEIENAVTPAFDEDGNLLIDAEHPGPMQIFYVRTGATTPECVEAVPPLLVIQGADDADTTITINDLELKLHAGETNRPLPTTVVIELLNTNVPTDITDTMRILVLSGMVTLQPGTLDELLLPPGYWSAACLGDPQSRGMDNRDNDLTVTCPRTEPQLITEDMITALTGLEGLPGNVIRKVIKLPALLRASGSGGVIVRIIFGDPDALELARELCDAGLLPPGICNRLFG